MLELGVYRRYKQNCGCCCFWLLDLSPTLTFARCDSLAVRLGRPRMGSERDPVLDGGRARSRRASRPACLDQ